jgi:hypothetical protein
LVTERLGHQWLLEQRVDGRSLAGRTRRLDVGDARVVV